MQSMDENFSTSDFYLAVFFLTKGIKICEVMRQTQSRSLFIFDISIPDGRKIAAEFLSSDTTVNLRSFVTNIRTAKEYLYSGA